MTHFEWGYGVNFEKGVDWNSNNNLNDGWHPLLLVRSIQGGRLGRTQYAKGQYAVRNNSVKSYAALKNNHFSYSFYVITAENITQRLKTRNWQIHNANNSQWYE